MNFSLPLCCPYSELIVAFIALKKSYGTRQFRVLHEAKPIFHSPIEAGSVRFVAIDLGVDIYSMLPARSRINLG